ncbi:ribosomal protein-like protein S15 [Macroventuria anomochaeta]|uniref:Ribosomal protein-like protein S15 n=1 Tax=Macroventuria anomochaeta TaxID=301207 RepID=A0ACB6RKK8_9PLEO|nr:ribosomal protein-like protein S15 [Macroventuria anomochaeta]KAF2621940.1 ribosomal protein-like protein S15 [Macroventuria anomochaeta]
MPPRIPVPLCLRASSSPSAFSLPLRAFSTTGPLHKKLTSLERKQRFEHDPYVAAQKARKKAANLSRRAELEQSRVDSLGNPVRGVSTPFVQSFDTGRPAGTAESTPADHQLNYRFDPTGIESQLEQSKRLAVPLSELAGSAPSAGPHKWSSSMRHNAASNIQKTADEIVAQNKDDHARAAEAIARITALENGSSKDRMRVNITRCINTFGRHNTDKVLPPRAPHLIKINSDAPPAVRPETNVAATGKRIGPDTGSSEVQIAILTAKIKTLADFLSTRGKGDKHNKRNLRLLVHRRQKLLQYLRRRERGGPRWQHCIETLGLTEGTWKGEISL